MAYFSEQQLPRYRDEDLPGTVKKLYNFCRELQEMLQFVLSNLDGDNIEGYEEIFNRLTDADGNISILKQTAEEIMMQVRQGEEKLGELSVRADGITARVQDTETGVAELKVTAQGISSRVADNQKNISSVTQTASSLTTRVASAEGDISTLEQTASGLTTRVSNAEGSLSTVSQTANSIKTAVYGSNNSGASTTISANGLIYEVFNQYGKFSRLQQTVDGFDFDGLVTFYDLEKSGRTEINGDNITTGTIELARLDLSNNYGYIELGRGSTGHEPTRGILICGPERNDSPSQYRNHFFASNAAARIMGEDKFGYESIYVSADDIEATLSPSSWSDERLKNEISYDLTERYGAFYRSLKPARYHMNSSRSGRFHTGFIAQQVRDALEAGGLTRQDLAALVQKDYDPEREDGGGGQYSIRYSEMIALNTAMVQTLMARVDALEYEVSALKGGA